MAVPTGTQTAISITTNLREDLSKIVYALEPDETPIFSKSKKITATKHQTDWLTDGLRAAKANAQVEGDDITAAARTPRPRLNNMVQIFADVVRLSDTAEKGATAEGKKQFAIEMAKELKAHKLDIELAFFANNAKVTGDGATVANELAGLPAWIATNTVAGVGGVDPAGDGTNARTDGTLASFVEADLKSVMQDMWTQGSMASTVYLPADLQTAASAFTGNAPRREMKDAGKVTSYIDVYITDFSSKNGVEFVPHRHMRTRDVILTDDETIRVGTYIPTKQEPLGKTGLSNAVMISTQLSLIVGNEKKLGGIFDRQP
tara:strand:+ start:18226 stop:19179 length:954 start_codon:yes stop_codon:yes gene_type:complete